MKNSNVHATLSDVHRLLSTYTSEDFARASEYHGLTPHLRDALRALSIESSRASKFKELRESPSDKPGVPPRKSKQPDIAPSGVTQKLSLVSMLQQQPRFVSTQLILQFAKECSLDVEPRPKESRERLANRVADAILNQTVQRQSQIVGRLIGGADSQTQGWLDVIKGSR